jgi:4-amino-4-deoxy-L-arabinose transferase-like glycosyltransferase
MLRKLLIFLAAPLAIVLAINLRIDYVKLLWFDEMIVSRVALQPHLSDLWKILTSGQSPHPPLNFLAVRAVYAAFGVSELTTRIPATLGFTVMLVCLFFFASKRVAPRSEP